MRRRAFDQPEVPLGVVDPFHGDIPSRAEREVDHRAALGIDELVLGDKVIEQGDLHDRIVVEQAAAYGVPWVPNRQAK